jgi:hypothetical protein
MSKKKRRGALFDFDAVKARVQSKNECSRRIRECVENLVGIDLNDIVSSGCSITENEALQLISSKLTFQGLCNLRKALQIVPSNITRVDKSGMSLHSTLTWEAFKSLCVVTNVQCLPTMENFMLYITVMERYCHSFLSLNDSTAQRRCQTFLSPPLSECLRCEKKLAMHNNPSTATRFTLDGPVVCSKITLECRSCSICYGICNFTDSSGTRYYPPHLCSNVVEVSNVTYFDLNLYRWIPSLRYL